MPNNDNVTLSADERAALYADMDASPGDYTPNEWALRHALDAETARADNAERTVKAWEQYSTSKSSVQAMMRERDEARAEVERLRSSDNA